MNKTYLFNPLSGSKIKNWSDGSNFWALDVGEIAGFSEKTAEMLRSTYGFLQVVSQDEYEAQLAKLESTEIPKIRVGSDGSLQPKSSSEIAGEKATLEEEKKALKAGKEKLDKAKDAEPDVMDYWEMNRGSLINELKKREIEIKGLGKKGVTVSKEQLINLLENDDASR